MSDETMDAIHNGTYQPIEKVFEIGDVVEDHHHGLECPSVIEEINGDMLTVRSKGETYQLRASACLLVVWSPCGEDRWFYPCGGVVYGLIRINHELVEANYLYHLVEDGIAAVGVDASPFDSFEAATKWLQTDWMDEANKKTTKD